MATSSVFAQRSQGSAAAASQQSSHAGPAQSYAAFCKIVLQKRLKNMFVLTSAAAYASLLLAVFDPRELPGSLVNILPVLLFFPLAFLGGLPVLILRKQTVTTALPSTATRFSQLASLRHPSTIPILLAYLAGAAFLSTSYVWCASYVSRDAQLGVLVYHKGRDSYVLNERRTYLTLLHVFLVLCATVEHILGARSRVVFDADASATIPARLAAKASARIPRAVQSVVLPWIAFHSTYSILRQLVLRAIVTSFLGPFARPYLYTILRTYPAFSITLVTRALTSSALIVAVWEAVHVVFDVYATQPLLVSQFASNANHCLIDGLRSSDPYFQHFAYLELSTLTLTNPERRKAIFTDIRQDTTKGSWTELSRECLKLIGTELQRAKGRGQIAAPPSAAPSSQTSTSSSPQKSSSIAVRDENVFRPTKKTFFDSLAAGASGPASAAPAQAATSAMTSAVSSSVSAVTSRVPSIFQTGAVEAPIAAVKAEVQAVQKAAMNVEQRLASWTPTALKGSLYTRRPELVVGVCVPKRREAVWAISSLSDLLCASLKEDPYGVAQRDIPKILEGFVRYLDVLDDLAKFLTASAESLVGWEREELLKEISEQVTPVQTALRNGVREIVTEFEPFLSEFRFPTAIATRLQLLVDWG